MIQNTLQYLLKHPDIALEAPASNDYIEEIGRAHV